MKDGYFEFNCLFYGDIKYPVEIAIKQYRIKISFLSHRVRFQAFLCNRDKISVPFSHHGQF